MFSGKKGVVWTRVGYAGGKKKFPTYQSMKDHTEVVQVKYDNKTMTYAKLLQLFKESHQMGRIKSIQYRSVILTHGDDQKKAAEAFIAAIKKKSPGVGTSVEELKEFYYAEEYHQKWNKKNFRGKW